MREFRFIGSAADTLENGRPVEPGEYTGPINEKAPKNAQLRRDGLLLEVPDGTAQAHEDGDTELVSSLTRDVDPNLVDPSLTDEVSDEDDINTIPGGDTE